MSNPLDPPTPPPSRPRHPAVAPNAGSSIPLTEDLGSQALAEALRSSFLILKFIMALVAALVVFSGVFTVESNEVAVVLRFGRPVGVGSQQLLKPGLHWAFPFPIDEIVRVPVGQSHSVSSTIGWYATTPALEATGKEPPLRNALLPGVDGYTLTADGNIIHARATLKYRIAEPLRHSFHFGGVSNLLQNALNNSLLHAAAQFTADTAIYRDKIAFKEAVLDRLNETIAQQQLGIVLDPFDVQVIPPLDVKAAFEAVLAAEQERSQKINEARGYANEVTLKAVGEAQALLSAGRGASNQIVQAVAAEATFFRDQLPHFEKDATLFTRRLLTETIEQVMTNAQDKFFFPAHDGGTPREVRLQLNREPMKLTPKETGRP